MSRFIQNLWYGKTDSRFIKSLLVPLAFIFRGIVALRRLAYRREFLASGHLSQPTIVVGNIVVGGSGKTPVLIALADALQTQGFHPGIISRGYGAKKSSRQGRAAAVQIDSTADEVGDEPLLIARRTGCPVWVGTDRLATGQALLAAHPQCDIILSDDGLQHYRLQRDVEIVVFDARGIGNGHLLPLGPLREPLDRLQTVDALLLNGIEVPDYRVAQATNRPIYPFSLRGQWFYQLGHSEKHCQASDFSGRKLYAVAGIGHPQRFFDTLTTLGLQAECRSFADHHRFSTEDLAFAHDGVLLMTEKDAVKCAALVGERGWEIWVLPVTAHLPDGLIEHILEKINGCKTARYSGVPGLQGQSRI